MLIIIEKNSRLQRRLLQSIALAAIAVFNTVAFMFPDAAALRVVIASICVLCLLCLPTVQLLISKRTGNVYIGNLKKVIGVFYLIFLLLLMPRVFEAVSMDLHLFSNTVAQVLTFLSLVLLLAFSLPAYLLLMKEETDKIMQVMATTDALTGLPNRHSFLLLAEPLFQRHKERKSPIGVIFFDVDNFKQINDHYGHAFGDQVLRKFAGLFKSDIRAVDLPCRYGGEEIVVFLPRADAATTEEVARRVMEAVTHVTFAEQPGFTFTVSAGIAGGVPDEDKTLHDYISYTDKALYSAKKGGKNTVVRYSHLDNVSNDPQLLHHNSANPS